MVVFQLPSAASVPIRMLPLLVPEEFIDVTVLKIFNTHAHRQTAHAALPLEDTNHCGGNHCGSAPTPARQAINSFLNFWFEVT